jgi:hypothetical protein
LIRPSVADAKIFPFPSFENKGAGVRLGFPGSIGEKTAGSSPYVAHTRTAELFVAPLFTRSGRGASQAARSSALELDSPDEKTPPVLHVLAENREYEEEAEQRFLVSMWLSLGIPQCPNWPRKKLGLIVLDVGSTNFYKISHI